MSIGKDLVAASATPPVLSILAEGESYGYAILKRVEELSGGALRWTDGMLYPVLHRLERNGFVEAHWGRSETFPSFPGNPPCTWRPSTSPSRSGWSWDTPTSPDTGGIPPAG
ncbi:MAG: helix-turn-helix transcriptional regulator [Acidobacteriota bacterium]|jgi:hypothetical protein